MKYKNLLWDWNGTLMDDVGIALDAVNAMLRRRMLQEITIAQYYDYIDTPIIRFYEKCFDMTKTSEAELLPEFQRFYALYAEDFPKDGSTLRAVRAAAETGHRQFIISSCENVILKRWLDRYGVSQYFEAVSGADDLRAGSKTGRAAALLDNYALKRDETVLIGDTLHDRESAAELGIDCILVSYGHQSPEENKKTGCPVADSLEDVIGLI